MTSALKSGYLIGGDDEAKILAVLQRLRERAEREQGPGALERIPAKGNGTADLEALEHAIGTLSLTATHRYVLIEGAERIPAAEAKLVGGLLTGAGEDLTLVFLARGEPKPALVKVIEAAGGEVHGYSAPKRRELPAWLANEARGRGIELAPAAAKALIERVGERTARLAAELDRLALWAEPGERIERDDVAASVADESEQVIWSLSDAIIDRRPDLACRVAEQLLEQDEAIPPIVYGTAKSLRNALRAAEQLRAGTPSKQVESLLGMHPYAAKKLVQRVAGTTPDELQDALGAIAGLEWDTRGGSPRDDRASFVLAIRAAAGAAAR